MGWFKSKTPAEILRENKRALDRAIRELDRERAKMEQQEKKVIVDIKKAAKANQQNACKIMAKDLVRTRRYVQKFIQMRAELQGVSLRLQTMKSNQSMSQAMVGVTKAMRSMNRTMNLPQMKRIMMDFERQSEMMDMKEEMMNDTMDDALGEEDDEEESEQIVNAVFDEIGISLDQAMPSAGVGTAVAMEEEDSLQARLDSLRK